jgi:hypothetical protein
LYIIFRCGTDPIRSDTGAYTISTPTALILSDPIPELIHPFPEWIRSDTEDLAPSSGVDPILSDPIPKLIHPLPEWVRSFPVRYRSLYPFFRNGSDPIRSDTRAYASSSGMDPILSDPIPELIPYIPVWNRSYPIRYRSLYILYRDESDPIRSGTGAYALSSGVEPILSAPIPELIHPLPKWTRPYPTRYRSLYTIFRCGTDPIRSDTGVCTLSSGRFRGLPPHSPTAHEPKGIPPEASKGPEETPPGPLEDP